MNGFFYFTVTKTFRPTELRFIYLEAFEFDFSVWVQASQNSGCGRAATFAGRGRVGVPRGRSPGLEQWSTGCRCGLGCACPRLGSGHARRRRCPTYLPGHVGLFGDWLAGLAGRWPLGQWSAGLPRQISRIPSALRPQRIPTSCCPPHHSHLI